MLEVEWSLCLTYVCQTLNLSGVHSNIKHFTSFVLSAAVAENAQFDFFVAFLVQVNNLTTSVMFSG